MVRKLSRPGMLKRAKARPVRKGRTKPKPGFKR